MDDNKDQLIKDLTARVEKLEKWQAARTAQQITYPLDINSQQILNKYLMAITDVIDFNITGVGDRRLFTYVGIQNSLRFQVTPLTLYKYSANPTTDTITLAYGSLPNDTAVYLYSDGTYPPPLDVDIVYYVINSVGSTLQLSLSPGGAAINITGAGSGQQYMQTIIVA